VFFKNVDYLVHEHVFMATLCNRAGHIYFHPVVCSSSFFSFRLISPVADWMSTTLPPWCGLSANLECRSETCCTRLAGNAGCKKSPSAHHRTTLSGYIVTTKARIDNRKKLVKEQYLLQLSPQYGELLSTSS